MGCGRPGQNQASVASLFPEHAGELVFCTLVNISGGEDCLFVI